MESLKDFPEIDLGTITYSPGWIPPETIIEGQINAVMHVKVHTSFLFDSTNQLGGLDGIKKRVIWGTDIYTDDSDIIAALFHSHTLDFATVAKAAREASADWLNVRLRILPCLQTYQGSVQSNIRSRSWYAKHDGLSFQVDKVDWVSRQEEPTPAAIEDMKLKKRRKAAIREFVQQRDKVMSIAV